MIFFDTNILLYSTIAMDREKHAKSELLIVSAMQDEKFSISPLVLTEYAYVLSKMKINSDLIYEYIKLYKDYVSFEIDMDILDRAFDLCNQIGFYKIINDAVHASFAEQYCEKLLTYDKDFLKFQNLTNIEIDIL